MAFLTFSNSSVLISWVDTIIFFLSLDWKCEHITLHIDLMIAKGRVKKNSINDSHIMALMDVRSTITSIELCQSLNIFRFDFRFDFRFKNSMLYPSWTGRRCNLKIRQSLQVAIRFRWNIILSISITIIECKVHISIAIRWKCSRYIFLIFKALTTKICVMKNVYMHCPKRFYGPWYYYPQSQIERRKQSHKEMWKSFWLLFWHERCQLHS